MTINYRGSQIHLSISLSIDDSEPIESQNLDGEFDSIEQAIQHAKAIIDANED
jgi:hypothetical protein